MALVRTYTWQDAISRVAGQMQRTIEDSQAIFACNDAQNLVWERYPWRESLKPLPPFWLMPKEQDYGAPSYAVPADFLALHKAWAVNVDGLMRKDLNVRRDLALTQLRDYPESIGYEAETGKFRIWPKPPDGIGPSTWIIDGVYKFQPAKVTAENLGSALLPWADRNFSSVCAALHWALTPNASPSKQQLKQIALAEIEEMANREGLALGDPVGVSPVDALVSYAWPIGLR